MNDVTTATLAALLARVQAATGPDREVDRHICWLWGPANGEQPYYTADTDAALALVEAKLPGWRLSMDRIPPTQRIPEGRFTAELSNFNGRSLIEDDDEYFGASIASLPLAILASLLKALIAQKGERT